MALALVSSAFLIILSVTGVILAYDAIAEKTQAHRIENLENITLAQVLPILRDQYSEVLELKIDHNQKGKGKLVIHYHSLDELDGILNICLPN